MQHLGLVAASVAAAVAIGLPLAIAVAARPRASAAVLAVAGMLQTVPSLTLLIAVTGVPQGLRDAADALAIVLDAALAWLERRLRGGSLRARSR